MITIIEFYLFHCILPYKHMAKRRGKTEQDCFAAATKSNPWSLLITTSNQYKHDTPTSMLGLTITYYDEAKRARWCDTFARFKVVCHLLRGMLR